MSLACSIFLKESICRFNPFYLYCMRVFIKNSIYTVDQTKQAIDNLIPFTGILRGIFHALDPIQQK